MYIPVLYIIQLIFHYQIFFLFYIINNFVAIHDERLFFVNDSFEQLIDEIAEQNGKDNIDNIIRS